MKRKIMFVVLLVAVVFLLACLPIAKFVFVNLKQGYVVVDASPGHPGRVTGYLQDWSDSGTPEQAFVLESRDGDARGVSFRVYRAE